MLNKYFNLSTLLLVFSLVTSLNVPTLAQAADSDYEEISYENLLNQLSIKKPKTPTRSVIDDTKIHAGIGYIGSTVGLRIGNHEFYRFQDGLQLNLGMDLFSPHWGAELAFRNFGQNKSRKDTLALREFDLKIYKQGENSAGVGYRIGGGLASRYLKFESEEGTIRESTPSSILFAALTTQVTEQVNFVLEGSYRASLVGETIDKRGADFGLLFDTEF
ncbi:MAG: hypothetical protein AB7O96_10550 [Pseudobdellovibrionaceae bacterium]